MLKKIRSFFGQLLKKLSPDNPILSTIELIDNNFKDIQKFSEQIKDILNTTSLNLSLLDARVKKLEEEYFQLAQLLDEMETKLDKRTLG